MLICKYFFMIYMAYYVSVIYLCKHNLHPILWILLIFWVIKRLHTNTNLQKTETIKIVVNCTNFGTSVWNVWRLDLLQQALNTYWCPGGEMAKDISRMFINMDQGYQLRPFYDKIIPPMSEPFHHKDISMWSRLAKATRNIISFKHSFQG